MNDIQADMSVNVAQENIVMTDDDFFDQPHILKELARLTEKAQYQYQRKQMRKNIPTFDILSSPDTPPEENKEAYLKNIVSNMTVFHIIFLFLCEN